MSVARHTRFARSRGFTLIELMVAITAGLFVAIAAFALARQGSRFFQQEARIANAQFSATLGFDRLRADIARAGFLSSANIQRDPFRCGSTAGWPSPGMPSLASVRIEAATPAAVQDAHQRPRPRPDHDDWQLLVGRDVPHPNVETVGGGQFRVILQQNNGGFARANLSAPKAAAATTLFQTGRVLRILDGTGHYEFGVDRCRRASTRRAAWSSRSSRTRPSPFKRDAGGDLRRRGVRHRHAGERRQHDSLRDPRPEGARPSAVTARSTTRAPRRPGDETRHELVRVELDSRRQRDGRLARARRRIRRRPQVRPHRGDGRCGNRPEPHRVPYSATPTIYNYAFDVATNPTAGAPNASAAVRARLTVRSREADRGATSRLPRRADRQPSFATRWAATPAPSPARARSPPTFSSPTSRGVAW